MQSIKASIIIQTVQSKIQKTNSTIYSIQAQSRIKQKLIFNTNGTHLKWLGWVCKTTTKVSKCFKAVYWEISPLFLDNNSTQLKSSPYSRVHNHKCIKAQEAYN